MCQNHSNLKNSAKYPLYDKTYPHPKKYNIKLLSCKYKGGGYIIDVNSELMKMFGYVVIQPKQFISQQSSKAKPIKVIHQFKSNLTKELLGQITIFYLVFLKQCTSLHMPRKLKIFVFITFEGLCATHNTKVQKAKV